MTTETETEFYQRRIAEELEAEAHATSAVVRDRHRELAALYAVKLDTSGQSEPSLKTIN